MLYKIVQIAAIASIVVTTMAQSIVPSASSSTFPGCALSCNVLLQAQALCTPPTAATTNQLAYDNCFCQSTLLQTLYATPDSVCAAECSIAADRTLLQSWFIGFCQQVGQGVDPVATTAATQPTNSVVVVTITSTNTPAPTITGSGTGAVGAASSDSSWISTHWKWVMMLGILFFGLIGLAFLLVWLKRRHRRKVEARRAALSGFPTPNEKRGGARSATPDLWGPHQHMHATNGWQYPPNQEKAMEAGVVGSSGETQYHHTRRDRSSKGKSRDRMGVAEIPGGPASSKTHDKKGKARDNAFETGLDNRPRPEAETSRSRSRRPQDSERNHEKSREISRKLKGIKDRAPSHDKRNKT